MEAYSKAYDALFVNYIELDVRLTADRKLVCLHNNIVIDKYLRNNLIGKLKFDASCDKNLDILELILKIF